MRKEASAKEEAHTQPRLACEPLGRCNGGQHHIPACSISSCLSVRRLGSPKSPPHRPLRSVQYPPIPLIQTICRRNSTYVPALQVSDSPGRQTGDGQKEREERLGETWSRLASVSKPFIPLSLLSNDEPSRESLISQATSHPTLRLSWTLLLVA